MIDNNARQPQELEGAPAQQTGAPPELTSPVDDHIRQGVDTTPAPSPLDYAARAWKIFPCHSIQRGRCTCSKGMECESPGKHPRTLHGVDDASSDLGDIRAWMSRWPDANWAVATGHVNGFIVIDIDPRHNGFTSMNQYEENRPDGPLPVTLRSSTGGGGRHLFYLYPPDATIKGDNRGKWLKGVDIKSDGGYVILPEAQHKSGGRYKWINWLDQLAWLPPDVAHQLSRTASSTGNGGGFKSDLPDTNTILQGVPEGQRDDVLFREACRLRRQLGDNARRAVEILILDAASHCTPPFPPEEALRKVEQAYRQDHSDRVPDQRMAVVQSWADQTEAEASRLNLKRGSEIRNRERPEMLIENVLPPGALFQVFGQTGEYKSFVVLSMIGAIANGVPWLGHEVNESGHAALILGEGGFDLSERLSSWLHGNPGTSDDRMLFSVEEGLDLMEQQEVGQIIDELLEFADDWKLIIFDTQADHMPNGDEDKAKDFTVIKKALQRIAHATGSAVGVVHHTGWDDSRERGSSRQRQALDVVTQIKDQRITNIKQKFGQKFEPIKFTVEEAPGTGSIYVRLSTEGEQLRQAFESINRVNSGINVVKALAIMLANPGISGNKIIPQLHIQRSSWADLRDFLEMQHYIACERNDNGHVPRMSVTEHGANWLAAKQAEAS
jgi:hypothetical protein